MTSRHDPERLAALTALGLGSDASARDIVSAYRRLARSSHPDTAAGSPADPDFARINAAYRLLTGRDGRRPATTRESQRGASADPPYPSQLADFTPWEVPSTQLWADDPPVVAGPVIIRPLPPEPR